MNLYIISQSINDDYNTYDSAVVAAISESQARLIRPGGGSWEGPDSYDSWCASPEDVSVELIGVAVEGTSEGVILASFNAG